MDLVLDEISKRTKSFLKEYIIIAIYVFFMVCVSSYLVYKYVNVVFVFAVVFSLFWLLSILFNIYKIIMDIRKKNIYTRIDRVLVILEEYYDNYFIKKEFYYLIHFDNYNHGKTPFKYNGKKISFKEDDFVEIAYLGRSKILINVNKINKK